MAQKRRLFQKDNNGNLQEQLIASSADIVQIEAISGINATNVQDALEEIKTLADTGGVTSVNGKTGAVTLSKSDIGLGNVTNEAQIPASEKGANGGVATLGSDGKIPEAQLPSYVDDILDFSTRNSFPPSGESGKIYVATDTNKSWRWSGSTYVEISSSLALGETSSTAYAGDKGKQNAENISSLQGTVEDLISDFEQAVIGFQEGTFVVGHALSANALETARNISIIGDASGSASFNGSADANINLTLKNSGVAGGTYSAVAVNSKGIVTSGGQIVEWGVQDQSAPDTSLISGGLFFKLV